MEPIPGRLLAHFLIFRALVLILLNFVILDLISHAEYFHPFSFAIILFLVIAKQGLGNWNRSEKGRQGQEMSYVLLPRLVLRP